MVSIKIILYAIFLPFIIFMMEGLDLNKIFKQNRVFQARMMYLLIAISMTYLTVNFFLDFANTINII